ncbi:response regulator transcription factor [Rubrobacter taiwanensis]|uniref:Response regulator transcription factor n=1 Tax=Rubrobacter taiwanensis TaxID=185139 RepID=A0A4R1BLA5_9ACTN|nr:response regulator transcription factor [Rubrobacter taiwanensis]TCJ18126.1 response regulator transcription factor [Rubrobacter taiwanensis]
MRILIVEDEPAIVEALKSGLTAHGYRCISVDNGEDAVLRATTEEVDLVLLDLMLPGIDGRTVLNRIRVRRPDLPVLVLTARDDLASKVSVLDSGADDYLTKPFAFEELLARIRALLRRPDQPQANLIEAGELRMDLLSHRVWRGGEQIELSSREFDLLEYFMRHPRQLLSRQQILSSIWNYSFDPGTNVVDVYVGYLRKKIDRPGAPTLITTVRGAGYRFDPPAGDSG